MSLIATLAHTSTPSPSPSPMVVGLDIGYSNLKLVWSGAEGRPVSGVYPSGSAPLTDMPMREGRPDVAGGELVLLPNGSEWVGAVPHRAPQTTVRVLDAQFPSTEHYKATFLAALAKIGASTVDLLVTGLPVAPYYEANGVVKQRLRENLVGTHFIRPGLAVTVKAVEIMPQPMGAFLSALPHHAVLRQVGSHNLVLDPGFFSFDWVLVADNVVRHKSSGSSKRATSTVLANAAAAIKASGVSQVSVERLEDMIRAGAYSLVAGGKTVDIRGYLDAGAAQVANQVAYEVLAALRAESEGVNAVLLSGGGAKLFEGAMRKAFAAENVDVIVPAEHVLSNALGFYGWGVRKHGKPL